MKKKVLNLMLAFVMMVTLCVPATTYAGTGTNSDPDEIVLDNISTAVFEEGSEYVYMWTPEEDGTLKITINSSEDDWRVIVMQGRLTLGTYSTSSESQYGKEFEIEVTEGSTISLGVSSDSGEAGTVKFMAAFTATGSTGSNVGTYENPAELVLDDPNTSRAEINTAVFTNGWDGYYYSWTATESGTLTITIEETEDNWGANIDGTLYYMSDYPNKEISVEVSAGQKVSVNIGGDTSDAGEVMFVATFIASGSVGSDSTGTLSDPKVIEAGEHSVDLEENNEGYYYKWTAPSDGTVTVKVSADIWCTYSVSNLTTGKYGDNHNSSDNTYVVTDDVSTVKQGDELQICVGTFDWNWGPNPKGTINLKLEFTAGSSSEGGNGPEGGNGTENPDNGSEYYYADKNVAVFNFDNIKVGNNEITVYEGYPTTIFGFQADEAGKYTITADSKDVVVNYWGTSYFGFASEKPEGNSNTYVLNYETAGPTVYIGVSGNCTLTVERTGDAEQSGGDIDSIEWTIYENKVEPEKFTFVGDKDKLEYIDVTDDVKETVVLGTDGYYHFNNANGPIVYVNIGDKMPYGVSLIEAYGYGRIRIIRLNADGTVKEKIDYNEAFLDYYNCLDKDGLYPLTDDLIEILKSIGEANGWYDSTIQGYYLFGDVIVDKDNAWMFACCYVPGDNDGDNTGSGENNGNDTPNTPDTPSEKNDTVVTTEEINKIKENITITGAPEGTELKVSSVEASVVEKVESFKNTTLKDKVYQMMDITLYDNAGVAVQPNGKVAITIPVMEKFKDAKAIEVFRYDEETGSLVSLGKYPVDTATGKFTFETNHFSTYVFAEAAEADTTENTTDAAEETTAATKDTPKTGDNVPVMPIVVVAVIAMAVLTVVIGTKKKEAEM